MVKKFFVTTAIVYPNADPHIGFAYELVLGDVQARWHRLKGEDVFFLTGSDEHGQKIQRTAEKAGKSPKQFVDAQVVKFKSLCSDWGVSFDRFIRTTDPDHAKVAQEVFKKVLDKGDIYLGEYEGLYCVGCEAFYLEKDLVDKNLCPIHLRPVEKVKEPSYFFRLSKYEKKLLAFYEKNPEFIFPAFRKNEIANRVKEGLNDLSVSRVSFDWGIPLPNDSKHVIYVWFDALLNYYSATREKKELAGFWPADVHNVGKDIAWFHCVIWPAMLWSAGIELPKRIATHGFVVTESGDKLSKTTGISIDPFQLAKTYGVDSVRYFFLREIPFGYDGVFSEEALVQRHNNELANELGNLASRVAALIQKKCNGTVKKQKTDRLLFDQLQLKRISQQFDDLAFNRCLEDIFSFIGSANKYVNDKRPWELEGKEAETVLYNLADSLRIISILLSPVIPATSEKINSQFGFKTGKLSDCKPGLLEKATVSNPSILFPKLELKKEAKPVPKARAVSVTVDPVVTKLGLKVVSGVIENVSIKKKHEGLEKLKDKTVAEALPAITGPGKEASARKLVRSGYYAVYKQLNVKNVVNSVDNLDELVKRSGQLPQINTAVDAYNVVSLKYGLVVGCHDIDRLQGNLKFAITNGSERYVPLGEAKPKKVAAGEFGVLDNSQIVCRLDEKQCESTKVTERSKHLVFYVQGNSETPDELLQKAANEIGELVTKYCGGSFRLM